MRWSSWRNCSPLCRRRRRARKSMAAPNGFSRLQIALHWLIAVLIVAAWFTHEGMGRALRTRIETGASGIEGNTLHVWFGGAAFALILIRIVVRMKRGAPEHVPGTSPRMALAATWGHRMLYVLMIAAPALGALAWYGGVRDAGEVHETVAQVLMIVALGHTAVALVHHFIMKVGTLGRMMRAGN